MIHPPPDSLEPTDEPGWYERVLRAILGREQPLRWAERALLRHPVSAGLLSLAALAAVIEERPAFGLKFHKRLSKRFVPDHSDRLILAIAQAQMKQWGLALKTLQEIGLDGGRRSIRVWLPGDQTLYPWANGWVVRIKSQALNPSSQATAPPIARSSSLPRPASSRPSPTQPARATAAPPTRPAAARHQPLPELPFMALELEIHCEPVQLTAAMLPSLPPSPVPDPWFQLREAMAHLELMQGFDELLCLPHLCGVTTYWYQVEAVRKVLRHFRGRVLLADEVGLGKTVEAGMVLKEYLMRGMAERILILTPASLVGQWQEEMASKFGILFATSHDPLLREQPETFWAQPRVIASIATARRAEHAAWLTERPYDLVIVDEAHHLKNRSTRNWQLVDSLKKRFMLLLSATPVQNSLLELYNLLTLLKPGLFQTEQEFRATYMTPRKPRVPANRERLRELMRDVMIRNTRALVDVRLPPRQAITLRVEGNATERACYRELDVLVRAVHQAHPGKHRLALHHLLTAAGSSPQAAAAALERFLARNACGPEWSELAHRYRELATGAKEEALIGLLRRNPEEKKMIFVHHRETLNRLARSLEEQRIGHSRFEGGMSGPEKDAAVNRFRDHDTVLLCTESGGEGRNLQFCNTLINFDLPWNPMAIEQRIGRIHRIGQTREVFLFNLVNQGSVEDRVLRILDEKLNLFELVVGEVDAILGAIDEEQDFAELVFASWVRTTDAERETAFQELAARLATARHHYEAVKQLDEELFGEEFESA